MKYYSKHLYREISYDKNLITQKEIQEIIDYILNYKKSPYNTDATNVNKWSAENECWLFYCKKDLLNKKEKYYFKMCWKIYIMFIEAEKGKKKEF